MKNFLSICALVVFVAMVTTGCGSLGQMIKSDSKSVESNPEMAESDGNNGFMIKVKQNNTGQNEMMQALEMLENIYGQPTVVTNASATPDGKASVRYTLYFDVNPQLYTVCTITNGQILSIDTMNKSAVVLEPVRVPVHKIVPAKTENDLTGTN